MQLNAILEMTFDGFAIHVCKSLGFLRMMQTDVVKNCYAVNGLLSF